MSDPVRPPFPLGILRDLLRKLRPPRDPQPGRDPGGKGSDQDRVAADRLRSQVKVIRRAFEELDGVATATVDGKGRARDDADAHFLFRPGHALVRDEYVGRLDQFLSSNDDVFEGTLREVERPTPGLTLVQLPGRRDGKDDVLTTIDEFESAVRRERPKEGLEDRPQPQVDDVIISPDHVVYVTGWGSLCPATEPEEPRTKRPWPPPRAGTEPRDADRIRVSVVDTGLWRDAVGSAETPWLETDDIFADLTDEEQVDSNAIHEYAGHGTFVAGVISCLAPDTRIEVEGVLTHGGAVYESAIVQQLDEAIHDSDAPQLISISAGTHTRGGLPMLSFILLAQNNKLDENDDVLIVAAAGNDSSDEPFWPAAFAEKYPWVVSVGSVDPDRKISDFSNYGKKWVKVYARGRNLVNAFPKGTYTCHEAPNENIVRHFHGLAQWSGTSFATPVVTGLIAAEMRASGSSARAAWQSVEATATSFHDTRLNQHIRIVGPLT